MKIALTPLEMLEALHTDAKHRKQMILKRLAKLNKIPKNTYAFDMERDDLDMSYRVLDDLILKIEKKQRKTRKRMKKDKAVGEKVHHKIFGDGVVEGVVRYTDGDQILRIFFPSTDTRKEISSTFVKKIKI